MIAADEMNLYYDRQGRVIDLNAWTALVSSARYKRVALTKLRNGYTVSTVWLGLDYSFGVGRPLMFETLVFQGGRSVDHEQAFARYHTEAEAIEGHARLVAYWRLEPPQP